MADKPDTLTKGLMFSKPLAKDECGFFVFQQPDNYSFWNKNVDYPISLFFLNDSFQIKNIGRLEAQQEKPCWADFQMTKYVIEGHEDLPKEYDIHIDDYCIPENNKIKIIKGKKNQ